MISLVSVLVLKNRFVKVAPWFLLEIGALAGENAVVDAAKMEKRNCESFIFGTMNCTVRQLGLYGGC